MIAVLTREVRCSACRALLARLEDDELRIRRNDLQVHIDGCSRVSIVCYQARCRTLNVVRLGAIREGELLGRQ